MSKYYFESKYLKLGRLWIRIWGRKAKVRQHEIDAAPNGMHTVSSLK